MRIFKNGFVVIAICIIFFVTGCFGKNSEITDVFNTNNSELSQQNESIDILHDSEETASFVTDEHDSSIAEPAEVPDIDTVNQEEQQADDNVYTINAEPKSDTEFEISGLEVITVTEEESNLSQTIEIIVGEGVVMPMNEETENNSDMPSYEDSPVIFSDAKFESIVRQFLGEPEGDIMQSSLSKIKYADVFMGLSFSYSANPSKDEKVLINMKEEDYPSSFDDVKYFTGLEYLSIPFIPVVDLTFISGMTNLKYLYMYKASLSDLSPLENLKNMEELNLAACEINDISVLANMTALKKLDLSENIFISDYSVLKSLKNLETLKLSGNQISNIDFVAGSVCLLELDLSKNNISSITSISNLINLKSLNLNKNNITDIKPLSLLTNLKKLYLTGNTISDINVLGDISRFSTLKYDN